MHWILQNNLFNEKTYQDLLDTLVKFNLPHTIHKVVPFIGELIPEPDLSTNNVICMGSYSLRHVSKKYGWNPGVFDLEPFDFTIQLHHWGENMFNHDSIISTFKDCVLTEDEMFIRPIHDSKVFAGKIIDVDKFKEWQHRVCELKLDCGDSLTENTLIQACPIKKVFSEHRFWVVKGEIATSSTYKIGKKVQYIPMLDDQIGKFAQKMVSTWEPLEAFVIDIADTPYGMKVIEINTLNSCGFYACNMQKLVMALEYSFNI
jgi:hypothetical protein